MDKPKILDDLPSKIKKSEMDDYGGTDNEHWKNSFDFFISCVGAAVGLGNIWRFPYLCYKNGGGSFLIPYAIVLLCAGIPIFFMEIALGQFMSSGGVNVWNISPLMRGVGYGCTIILFYNTVYYIVILAWTLTYMCFSFHWIMPWSHCDNWWNTDRCQVSQSRNTSIENATNDLNSNMSYDQTTTTSIEFESDPSVTPVDSVVEFWEHRILQISGGITEPDGFVWELTLALFIVWCLVYFCLWKGIKVAGKIVYFTALFPYAVLIILLIRGVTLPGAMEGIIFYLKPDFVKLTDPQVWIDAGTQVLYSYYLGFNVLIALGSHNKFHHNCYRDCIGLICVNGGTSFFAGFAVFSVLGFMAHEQGLSVADVAESGPGLVFITYPKAISMMPAAPLWALMFFIMILLVGLDTQFVAVEAAICIAKDRWPRLMSKGRREICIAIYAFICFLFGLPMVTRGGMYVFQLFDYYSCSGIAIIWSCLLETITVAWIYGVNRFYDNIAMMIGHRINPWLKICWCFITPVLLMGMFIWYCCTFTPLVYNRVYVYPVWAQIFGFCLSLSSIVCMPIYAVFKFCSSKGHGFTGKLRDTTQPILYPERIPEKWEDHDDLLRRSHLAKQQKNLRKSNNEFTSTCKEKQNQSLNELQQLKA